MKKIFAIVALAATLVVGGCATFQQAETTVSNAVGLIGSTKVNSKTAYIAINVFNAAERSVTAYLKLPPCTGVGGLCRVNGAAAALADPFNAGIVARNDLRSFMKANPGTLADAGMYKTLVAATASLQNIMNAYGIGGSK